MTVVVNGDELVFFWQRCGRLVYCMERETIRKRGWNSTVRRNSSSSSLWECEDVLERCASEKDDATNRIKNEEKMSAVWHPAWKEMNWCLFKKYQVSLGTVIKGEKSEWSRFLSQSNADIRRLARRNVFADHPCKRCQSWWTGNVVGSVVEVSSWPCDKQSFRRVSSLDKLYRYQKSQKE